MNFYEKFIVFSCITVPSFATQGLQDESKVSVQSYRKVDVPLDNWNLFSSNKTEELTIVTKAPSSGIIKCGIACHKNNKCGGFLYDKTSGRCLMKLVKKIE